MGWDLFINSNLPSTLATILAAFVAFLVYRKQKADEKRDAAKIILQEIRRAEDIISDYKQMGGYKFAKKIIATNSWSKNIHLFVGDLSNDELDRISNLYSTGEYLDILIKEISDYTFKKEIEEMSFQIVSKEKHFEDDENGQAGVPKNLRIKLASPWKPRLDIITSEIEPIYYSTIADKLRKVAKLK